MFGDACRISRDGSLVRKAGERVFPSEGKALALAHSLQLPVPALHAVSATQTHTEIVMDFVDGECLEEAWKTMDEAQKRSVAEQLRDIVSTMRLAPFNQQSIGTIDGPVRDVRQISDYTGGPFDSERELNDFVLDLLPGTPPAVRQTLTESLRTDHSIVFTHGDLSPRNIIVQRDRIQGLLDWELAGWYPEYWEYVKFFDRSTSCKEWKEYADIIFATEYPQELLTCQALARWQRP